MDDLLIEITTALDTFIEAMTLKTNYTTSNFKPRKEKVLAKVKKKQKKTELKQKLKPKQTKLVLSDPDFKKYLEELHRKSVIVTKAWNNSAFTYRKYYISKQLVEISPNKNKNSTSTYSQPLKFKEEIKTNIKCRKKFDLKITEQDKTLPIMYWLPKIDKTIIAARFIVASEMCSIKPLSDMIFKVIKINFN